MGRLFSTVYRVFLMGASISAVVLSIISMTSCDFLDFVHPYKANGRSLINGAYHVDSFATQRILQNDTDSEELDIGEMETGTTSSTLAAVGLVPTDYLAQLADSQVANISGTVSANVSDSVSTAGNNSVASAGTIGTSNTTTKVPTNSSISSQDAHSTSGTGGSAATASNIGEMEDTNITDSQVLTDDMMESTPFGNTGNLGKSNTTDYISPVALQGSAGLFCAADDDSIYHVWKGTFIDSENAINEESAHDESEDIARNGAVVSVTFGALVALILSLECILGWKMCCEKWIVSFLALLACVSQGMTFLFFNSDRYCDANIIHEILEQDPCVPGDGAKISIAALVLYALIMILVCRVPQDDPYHLLCCCRAQKEVEKTDNFSSLEMTDSGLMGCNSEEDGDNVVVSGRDHDSAPWMSESKKEKEENEII